MSDTYFTPTQLESRLPLLNGQLQPADGSMRAHPSSTAASQHAGIIGLNSNQASVNTTARGHNRQNTPSQYIPLRSIGHGNRIASRAGSGVDPYMHSSRHTFGGRYRSGYTDGSHSHYRYQASDAQSNYSRGDTSVASSTETATTEYTSINDNQPRHPPAPMAPPRLPRNMSHGRLPHQQSFSYAPVLNYRDDNQVQEEELAGDVEYRLTHSRNNYDHQRTFELPLFDYLHDDSRHNQHFRPMGSNTSSETYDYNAQSMSDNNQDLRTEQKQPESPFDALSSTHAYSPQFTAINEQYGNGYGATSRAPVHHLPDGIGDGQRPELRRMMSQVDNIMHRPRR